LKQEEYDGDHIPWFMDGRLMHHTGSTDYLRINYCLLCFKLDLSWKTKLHLKKVLIAPPPPKKKINNNELLHSFVKSKTTPNAHLLILYVVMLSQKNSAQHRSPAQESSC